MNRPMFDDSWRPKIDPDSLSRQAIQHDRWDDEDVVQAQKDVATLRAARSQLSDCLEGMELAPELGPDAMDDAFLTFLKSEPEVLAEDAVRPDRRVNRVVSDELIKLDETERLRKYSVNDPVQAALSTVAIEKDLEVIYDRLKAQQQKGEDLQKAIDEWGGLAGEAQDAQDIYENWKAGQGEGQGEPMTQEQIDEMLQKLREALEKAEQAKAKAEQAEQEFNESMQGEAGDVKAQLQKAVKDAADDAQQASESARAWGLDPGTLHKMDPTQRIELAKKLGSPKFKRIAELFGPMRNLLTSEQARKTTHSHEEVFDVGIGSDLGRVLPQEVLNLRPGPTRLDFLRRFTEGKLLQYELSGTEKLGRGGIVFCEDGSGSMSGERTIWAKAVGLALIHLARDQHREIHIFHFSGPGSIQEFAFTRPEDFTLDAMLAYAEGFYGGGTDYVGPMKRSLQVLGKEFSGTGKLKSDIVFASDGECHVPPEFMEEFLKEIERMDGAVWAIMIGGTPAKGGALDTMSAGKVATVQSLLSADNIRAVFRQVS
jgi:uncharacterized protein with von Willebrand factor type A (vWA) domain